MSCNYFVHNDPNVGSKEISGTTCDGSVVFYTLTYGQEVCIDTSKPYINLKNLVISGECYSVTPTPTPTSPQYCIYYVADYYNAEFQCPNDGNTYYDTYGKLTFTV